MRRSAGVLIAGTLLLAAGATTARAEGGYQADWVSQTPTNGTKIEVGERLDGTLVAKNTGTKAWGPNVKLASGDGANLHASPPSAFADDSWENPYRFANVSSPPVQPGQQGRFAFSLKGPPASSPRMVQAYAIPVAEGEYWMDEPIGTAGATWPTNRVHFDLMTMPSEPPKVTIDAAPTAVTAGAPVPVTATATDNVRVKAVAARIDNGPVAALEGSPAAGSVATTGLAPGPHTLTVTAIDGAGNYGPVSQPITIAADLGVANGAPAGAAKVTIGLASKRRSSHTAPFGRRVTVGGRLTTPDAKTPIAGARLQLSTRVTGTRTYRSLGEVTTGAEGRWHGTVPAGPSRRVKIEYRAMTLQPAPTAARTAALEVRAGVSLSIRRRGRVVRLSGRLRGGRLPKRGVLVSLQGKQRGDRWRPFKTVRAKGAKRAFSGRYRFKGGGAFRLRAVVNEQAGYPYSRGTSRARSVRVR